MATTFRNILDRTVKLFIREDDPVVLKQSAAMLPGRKSLLTKLKKYYRARVELELKKWKDAVAQAEDPQRPLRTALLDIYHRAMEDDHLLSQVRTARFTVQMGAFEIRVGDTPNEDLAKLLQRPWFDEYIQHAVDSELYGHSLVEFHPEMVNGEFQKVFLVPREHVRSERGEVVIYTYDDKGLPYREGALSRYLVEIGAPYDLGLLKIASKTVIRKEYALSDWSRRNEKYGMPFLVVQTQSRNEKELNEKEDMAANFGANAWAILDDQDKITMMESNQSFAYQSFRDYSEWADKAISILINGQTGTTEEKSFVGSAEVHERILNTYTKARMKRIQYQINFELLPFLRSHGYPIPEEAEFQYLDLEEEQQDDPMPDNMDQPDNQAAAPAPQSSEPQQQRLHLKKKSEDLTALYQGFIHCSEHEHLPGVTLAIDIGRMMREAIRRVYDNKVQAGDLDADLWRNTVTQLWEGVQEGWGPTAQDIAYESPSADLLRQLRSNLFVFAAFKNHAHTADLVGLLTDPATGQVRSWEEFRDLAKPITGNYYEQWLQAEYNTSVGTGQMAKKWKDFEANADILPYLQYKTQRDGRVRPAHAVLDGTTLPMDDPFWDDYYPPNGWNCRCNVIQTAGPEKRNDLEPNEEQTPVAFRNNPGKTGQVFSDQHPYFETATPTAKRRILEAMNKLLVDSDIYDTAYKSTRTGAELEVHVTHNTPEAARHIEIGKKLADAGISGKLMPVDRTPGANNVDFFQDPSKLWELTSPAKGYGAIDKALRLAARKTKYVVIDPAEGTRKGDLLHAVMSRKKDLKGVIVIWKGGIWEPLK